MGSIDRQSLAKSRLGLQQFVDPLLQDIFRRPECLEIDEFDELRNARECRGRA